MILTWTTSVSKICRESHTCENLYCTFLIFLGTEDQFFDFGSHVKAQFVKNFHTTLVIVSSTGYCMHREATRISCVGVLELMRQMDIDNLLV